jgi:tRNA(fMet)-specific endonuclease VapC
MNVLLDTCACIEILKGNMNVYRIVKSLSNSQRLVSEITVAELMFGVELSKRKFFEQQKVNDFLNDFSILPISNSIRRFAKEKARLQKEGTPIEDFDLLIGVSAVENNLMLITDNIRHMSRINDILIENWR